MNMTKENRAELKTLSKQITAAMREGAAIERAAIKERAQLHRALKRAQKQIAGDLIRSVRRERAVIKGIDAKVARLSARRSILNGRASS